MGELDGRVVIVTGASSGIGHAASLLFAAQGARVVAVARRRAELDRLVARIRGSGGEACAVAGDVTDESLHVRAVAAACERFGGLDVAFNNAGTLGAFGAVTAIDLAGWRATIETNLTSAFLAAKHQIPVLQQRGGGSLIFTATFVGHTAGLPGMSAYAASKSGLIGLARTLAAEHGRDGIRVNALLPGGTDTPMGRTAADTEEARGFVRRLHALDRIAEPDEIARAALFLASDAASFVTGSAMLVDGGASICRT